MISTTPLEIEWFQIPEKDPEPVAAISAGVIRLGKGLAPFEHGAKVVIGKVKGSKKQIALRRVRVDEPTSATFNVKETKGGGLSIKCPLFLRTVVIGEMKVNAQPKKFIQCAAAYEEETDTVLITL